MAIYLDHHATTPVDPEVVAAMMPFLTDNFGNAGSASHAWGRRAKDAVDTARQQVAEAVGASPSEVIFTSGATESINLAISGLCQRSQADRRQLVVLATEHAAVVQTCEAMADHQTVIVPVHSDGLVDFSALKRALQTPTLLVCAMAVNNEIGVIQPVSDIAEMCHAAGALLLCDCAQAPGRLAMDLHAWGVDLCSITAHKCYGPKGVGALIVRSGVRLTPLMHGGGQEGGVRPGTTAVPMVVALGACMARAAALQPVDEARIGTLRDRLLTLLQAEIEQLSVNGSLSARVGGNLNISIPCVDAATLMVALPELGISAGSACASGTPKPSRILKALGLSDEAALCSIRLGLGRGTTAADIDAAASQICAEVLKIRAASPLWALHQSGVELDW
ncbi:MAG: cysteine desulfurase [Myxococcales bacterium]|nr:cysteine desulfurase [Myxococcales bacterium]